MRSARSRAIGMPALACALVLGLLPAIGASSSNAVEASSLPPRPKPRDAQVTPFQSDLAKRSADERARAEKNDTAPVSPPVWPSASSRVVDLGQSKATTEAVDLRPVMADRPGLKARLRVLDRSVAEATDIAGFVMAISRADGHATVGSTQIRVDYSGFAHAYGGDWAARLKLVSLPVCALTTPRRAGCSVPMELPTTNNRRQQSLTASVAVGPGERAFAVTASSESSSGDYTATSLAPSSSWSAGGSSGDFTWSYPMRVPPSAGPSPKLSIQYSAQSVDGRTVAANNQASSVGEGFELTESYVERKYISCNDAGHTGKYDLCWRTDNAALVLNGKASELVKSGTGWRLKNDDGSRVEKVVNPVDNGDNDREAWKVTTLDGTQYFFGRHLLPGHSRFFTNSVWTVPVSGDNPGEPCYNATFANSFCDKQAWRWNLDLVIDPHNNAMSFWYATESNYYAKNGATTATKEYIRGGYLTRIQYGQRSDTLATVAAPMHAIFDTLERCLTNCASLTSATKGNWPDVPFDQICAAGVTCTKLAATFFSRRRLDQVTTQVFKGSAYQSVDHWQLEQDFPWPGDNMSGKALWLKSITHTGKASTPTAAAPLKVTFGSIPLENRVDGDDGISPMNKLRVGTIWTETGAQITVNYAPPQCVADVTMPASPDQNTLRCYPVKWAPPNEVERDDWFHRYVVEQVLVNDVTGGGDAVVTNYSYSGGAAWHHQDSPIVPEKRRNWSEWRGYRTVTTSSGDPAQPGPRSKKVTTYFRGMHGDKLDAGGTKTAMVPDSEGGSRADLPALAGLARETITYAAAGSEQVLTGTLTDYWTHETAAQTLTPTLTLRASFAKASVARTRTARDGGRADLVRTVVTGYNATTGLPIESVDYGDATKIDETCTITSYAQNPTTWMMSYPSRVVTSEGACDSGSANPSASRVISDVRTLYDGGGFGAAPTEGEVSATQRLNYYDTNGVAQYQTTATSTYDVLGRLLSKRDAIGRVTTTAYTPAGQGALMSTLVKTPPIVAADGVSKSLETLTTFMPEWGSVAQVKDPNGKLTDLAYDAVGRLSSVWMPDQSKAAGETPNTKYTYGLSTTAASWVRTENLNITANGYITTYDLYDSLLRPRQTQKPAVTSGRVIAETKYDSRGLAVTKNADVWDSGAPSGTLANVFDASVPAETLTSYDGAGRETVSTFAVYGQPKWSTRKQYGGDTVTTLPPNGAAATAEIKDARGRVIERREYDGGSPTPGFIHSSYTYDLAGQLTQLVSAGATWTYGYDLQGRKIRSTDPDAGTTTYGYDPVDRQVTATNANQKTVLTTYDNLDRKVTMHEGAKTDASLLADWIYDVTGNLGQLYGSTHYTAGKAGPAYKTNVVARNVLYKPTATSVVIPAAEGPELDGTYQTNIGYAPDARTVSFIGNPGGGTLGLEELDFTYNPLGLPVSMTSTEAIYVKELAYTPLGDPELYNLGSNNDMFIQNFYEDGTRRLKQSMAGDVTINANHSYTYDPAGNLLRDHNLIGSDTQCYDYDPHRRLTAAWTPGDGNCAAAPTVAGLGGPAKYWQSWTYTASGLRKTQTDHASTGDITATYGYAAGQPHAVSSITTTGAPAASYDYDPAGNTTARPGPAGNQTLNWDAEGKLRKLTQQSGSTDYIYDADGNLLLRKSPGKTTLFVGPLEVTLDTATRQLTSKRMYSIGGKEIAVRSSLANRSWLVNDYHGTSHVAINSSTLEATYRYSTPFGTPRGAEPATWPDQHGFLGKPEDKTTGLTHIGAREYDPGIGRFISVDPLMDTADPQQMLGYTYGNDNPTSMSDPTGLMMCECDGGGGGGGGDTGGTTGGGEENDNGGNNGGTSSGTNGGSDDDDDDDGGGNFFKRAVNKGKSLGKTVLDYQAGISNQAIDTGVGMFRLGKENSKCYLTFDCDFQINLAKSVVENPKVLWDATVDPIRSDWNNGNRAGAAGRVGFMFVEALLGTKGAGAAASTTARASAASSESVLKAAVSARASQAMASQGKRARGPVLSGAVDRETGALYFSQNTGVPKPTHPLLQERLDAFSGPGAPGKGEPGAHGEFVAVNEGLFARQGARIEDFSVYSVRIRGAGKGDSIGMCPNCEQLLRGAEDLGR